MENIQLSEFREFIKENTRLIVPHEYPTVLECNNEGEITDILAKKRSIPNIEGDENSNFLDTIVE